MGADVIRFRVPLARRLLAKLSPAERRAIVLATFASAVVAFMPGEWVSGVVLLIASYALFRANRDVFKKAEKQPEDGASGDEDGADRAGRSDLAVEIPEGEAAHDVDAPHAVGERGE